MGVIWGQLWTEHESQEKSDKHVEARELKLLVLKNCFTLIQYFLE